MPYYDSAVCMQSELKICFQKTAKSGQGSICVRAFHFNGTEKTGQGNFLHPLIINFITISSCAVRILYDRNDWLQVQVAGDGICVTRSLLLAVCKLLLLQELLGNSLPVSASKCDSCPPNSFLLTQLLQQTLIFLHLSHVFEHTLIVDAAASVRQQTSTSSQ